MAAMRCFSPGPFGSAAGRGTRGLVAGARCHGHCAFEPVLCACARAVFCWSSSTFDPRLAGGATPAAPTILGRQTSRLSWPQRRRPEQLGCNLAAVGPAPLLATRTPWPTCRART
eukprot:scaffold20656_cov66-Phaeocystis_antarctica.AAC.1